MKCAIIGYEPEPLQFRTDDVQKENELLNHLKTLIIEAYHNEYDEFHIGLRRGCEIWAGEAIISIQTYYETMSLCHVQAYKGYHNCHKESELDQLKHVSGFCDKRIHLSDTKLTADEVNRVYTDYILNKTDMVIAIHSSKVSDPFVTPLIKAIKEKGTLPLVVMNPFDGNFMVRRYNRPEKWLTYKQYRHHNYEVYRQYGI